MDRAIWEVAARLLWERILNTGPLLLQDTNFLKGHPAGQKALSKAPKTIVGVVAMFPQILKIERGVVVAVIRGHPTLHLDPRAGVVTPCRSARKILCTVSLPCFAP